MTREMPSTTRPLRIGSTLGEKGDDLLPLHLILRSDERRVKDIGEIVLIDNSNNQIPNGIREQIIVQGYFVFIERQVLQRDSKAGAFISVRKPVTSSNTGSVFGGNFKDIVKAIIRDGIVDSCQRSLQDRKIDRSLHTGLCCQDLSIYLNHTLEWKEDQLHYISANF
ncbi:hypothetical protein EMIT047CA2_30246 [Pseudomonas soli]